MGARGRAQAHFWEGVGVATMALRRRISLRRFIAIISRVAEILANDQALVQQ